MSTKIYNGYIFYNQSIDCVLSKLLHFKIFFQNEANEILRKSISSEIRKSTEIFTYNKKSEFICFDDIKSSIFEELDELKKGYRSTSFDVGFSVSCKQLKNNVLCYIFFEKKELKSLFEKLLKPKSYFYFDNVDRPKNISYRLWNDRDKNWKRALTKYSFHESGFKTIVMSNINVDLINDFSEKDFEVKNCMNAFSKYQLADLSIDFLKSCFDKEIKIYPSFFYSIFDNIENFEEEIKIINEMYLSAKKDYIFDLSKLKVIKVDKHDFLSRIERETFKLKVLSVIGREF